MKKALYNIQKQRLFVGSGVEDIYDSELHTVLDELGQYGVDYKTGKNQNITKILLNSGESKNENAIAKTVFSRIPKIKYDDNHTNTTKFGCNSMILSYI